MEKRIKSANPKGATFLAPSFVIKNVSPECQGEYVHPDLIHFVAEFEHEYTPDSDTTTRIKKITCNDNYRRRTRTQKWWSYELNEAAKNNVDFRINNLFF